MTTIDDWGVPDWRKVNAYPEPDELSKKWWRWEFLRRLQEYREDWLAITKRGLRATGPQNARNKQKFRLRNLL